MHRKLAILPVLLLLSVACFAQAYNARPKLVVLIVVDQLRGDLPERYHDEFVPDGFRRFMDQGAWFSACYYKYANTKTAPGHATIGTGTYTLGHGIGGNEWWDPARRKTVTSVEDDHVELLGANVKAAGASPHNLMTNTVSDELKLATQGRARVYGISLKDRAAILPVGYSADGAFWIDHESGAFVTSTFYMKEAPAWLTEFNASGAAAKYLNREWKDRDGKVLRTTSQTAGEKPKPFYDLVGATPFASDYTLDMARAVIEKEKLGTGPVTDFLSVSFSATDILGHKVGPDSPEIHEMLLTLDGQLAAFFKYLDDKIGAGNWTAAFTSDHGVAPMPEVSAKLRLPAFNGEGYLTQINSMLSQKYKREAKYAAYFDYPKVDLDTDAFAAVNVNEADAEKAAGEILVKLGMLGYNTKSQLAAGEVRNSVFAKQILNAYTPLGGWYVIGIMPPFVVGYGSGTGHALPYSYDAHVPLGFYGPQFRTGDYRGEVEPVDLAVTLSSILRINKPASAVGRVLTEAIAERPRREVPAK
jgi:hypothetical protein